MPNLSALWTVMRHKQNNYACMITMTGGRRTRTKMIINGKRKIILSSILIPKMHTRRKWHKKKNMLLKSKIKLMMIISMRMIRIIICDIRTMHASWMHTYRKLK